MKTQRLTVTRVRSVAFARLVPKRYNLHVFKRSSLAPDENGPKGDRSLPLARHQRWTSGWARGNGAAKK
jgi:hypothetical protein